MEFLDIIGKIIEFSEKGEEYSDEVKAIRATLESLQLTVQQIHPHKLPNHLTKVLNDDLEEANDLLKQTDKDTKSWLTKFKSMLPGSHLQKIKEKNQKLVHTISLINLHLNTIKSTVNRLNHSETRDYDDDIEPTRLKRLHTFKDTSEDVGSLQLPKKSVSDTRFDVGGATLQDEEDEFNGATQNDNPDDDDQPSEDVGLRLRVLYDERLGKVLKNCKDFIPIIEMKWDGKTKIEYAIQRLNFVYLPTEDATRISRDHAIVTAVKKAPPKKAAEKIDVAIAATIVDDSDKMFGATIVDDGADADNGDGNGDEVDEYILKDLSLNGTFYLKGRELLNFPTVGMKIRGDFQNLKKDAEVALENGDIIGLIMQKPKCQDLIFGFQLLTD